MNTVLWIITILLTLAFLASGGAKLTTPLEKLRTKMAWANDATAGQVKAIGAVEVLGALGLILPAVLHIATGLVPLAALGLALVMAGAAVVHLRRGDGIGLAVPSIVLGLLSLFVAIERFGSWPL